MSPEDGPTAPRAREPRECLFTRQRAVESRLVPAGGGDVVLWAATSEDFFVNRAPGHLVVVSLPAPPPHPPSQTALSALCLTAAGVGLVLPVVDTMTRRKMASSGWKTLLDGDGDEWQVTQGHGLSFLGHCDAAPPHLSLAFSLSLPLGAICGALRARAAPPCASTLWR